MIETIADMPPGTLGFVASGKLSRADYVDVAIPPLREAIDRGEKLRTLYEIADDFHGIEAGALWQDIKADVGLGIGHYSSWDRMAVVTDIDWLHKASGVFGWLYPGELKMFGLAERDAAKQWLAA
jgi:hypothetical protein